MVLTSLVLRRLSVLFLALSAALWAAKLTSLGDREERRECKPVATPAHSRNGVEKKGVDNPSKWLHSKLHSMSPTHFSAHPSCSVFNASIAHPIPVPNYSPQDASYLGTLSVMGTLNVRPGGRSGNLMEGDEVSRWLEGTSNLIRGSNYILACFATLIQKADDSRQVLNSLGNLGSKLVVSLANTELAQQASDEEVVVTVRALESSGMDWLGTYTKKGHILLLKRERVGLLAFCGVHKECGDGNIFLPFSPVKYSTKAAKSAVKELKERGVTLVVVLMFWGLESSYFPDEMALTIARQLSMLGVSAVLGYHPNSIQDHAYFGNTLVIFSLGTLLSSTKVANYCWNKMSGEWRYSLTRKCDLIHPSAREKMLKRELETRVYKLYFSQNRPVLAEYVTVQLEDHDTGRGYSIRKPASSIADSHAWTAVCNGTDTHCLACQQF